VYGVTERKERGCRYRYFGRHGGVSSGCFASLNVGYSLGDSFENVKENYLMIKRQIDSDIVISANQVHGDGVEVVDGDVTGDRCVDGVDALITDIPGIALMVQLADCQGILLHDPEHGCVSAIHSGWRGSVAGIAGKTIRRMMEVFGTDPIHLRAFVSPSLGPCCAEFVNYRTELPPEFHSFQVKPNHFDFWGITRSQLTSAGLTDKNIRIDGTCTSCSSDYFSYRRACRNGDGKTGRHCAVIYLQEAH